MNNEFLNEKHLEACGANELSWFHVVDTPEFPFKWSGSVFRGTLLTFTASDADWTVGQVLIRKVRKPKDCDFLKKHPLPEFYTDKEFIELVENCGDGGFMFVTQAPISLEVHPELHDHKRFFSLMESHETRSLEEEKLRNLLLDSGTKVHVVFVDKAQILKQKTYPFIVKGYAFVASYNRHREWVKRYLYIPHARKCLNVDEVDTSVILNQFHLVKCNTGRLVSVGPLEFPLMAKDNLGICPEEKANILNVLMTIKKSWNFEPPNLAVRDIIDPDFLPLTWNKTFAKQVQELREVGKDALSGIWRDDQEKDLEHGEFKPDLETRILGPAEPTSSDPSMSEDVSGEESLVEDDFNSEVSEDTIELDSDNPDEMIPYDQELHFEDEGNDEETDTDDNDGDSSNDYFSDSDGVSRSHRGSSDGEYEIRTRTVFRDLFQWQACTVEITDKKVKFITDTPQLPKNENMSLYGYLEVILNKMVDGFVALGMIDERKEKQYRQFIIKAQEYELPPGYSYDGKWHYEGKTENIMGVGVYYLSIGDLEGGDLVFSTSLKRFETTESVCNVEITEGNAVVFENSLIHRVSEITNNTDKPQSRVFINFFMVDPQFPIRQKTSYNTFKMLLLKKLPEEICDRILSFYGYPTNPWKFRMDVKKDMKAVKDSWIETYYGNEGRLWFAGDRRNYRRVPYPSDEESVD